jgi:hypothetical protein
MVNSADDLESLLTRLNRHYERVNEGTFLVRIAANQPPAALRLAPPLLVAQVEIGPVPEQSRDGHSKLFRTLLELNATDLVHAAYALEGRTIVLAAALETESLDINELEAVLADVDLALANHIARLKELT